MKKVLFGLFALTCISMASETNLYFRAGADFGGEFKVIKDDEGDLTKKDADDFAWEIAVEATREVYSGFELGLGIAYQDHGKPENYVYVDSGVDGYTVEFETPTITSIPLYITTKYNFEAINNFIPYIKANIGYSFNNEDGDMKINDSQDGLDRVDFKVKNGLYCGIGGGFEYDNFTMDLMYQINKAKAEVNFFDGDRVKDDFDYSRFTLAFGYKFNI